MQLLEREQSITALAECLTDSAKLGGRIALVTGEAGIGKTSLLQEFVRRASPARVLWGACDALFTPRPLAPLYDIARQTQGSLLDALSTGATREIIFSSALDTIEHEPALVVFEDTHWADEATLDLLKFIGRRIHRTRSLLAVTYRDDEVGHRHPLRLVIGDLPRASVRRLPLVSLSELAVAQLATQAGRGSTGLHALTGGNPLFVTEVLATDSESVPVSVKDTVLARVGRLTPAAREVAELTCVVPNRIEGWLLTEAAHPDDHALEDCFSIGMVRDEDGGLAFRHELMRRALEDSLTSTRLESLHLRILAVLAVRADVPAARLAHHADGARNADAVLRFAPLAAQQAAAVAAHREAAAHYELALRYAERMGPANRAQLLEQLAYELYLTHQIEPAINARQATLALWQKLGAHLKEGDTLRWLSRLSWLAGRTADAHRFASEAISVLEPLTPGAELAMAFSNRAQLDMLSNAAFTAIEWAQRAIELAQALESDEIVCHALNNRGTARVMRGEADGWSDVERSLQLALHFGLQEHVARAYINLSYLAIAQHRYQSAMRYLDDGITYCEEHDLDLGRLHMLGWRARARLESGDWQGAGEDADIVSRHPRSATVSRIPALVVLGLLRVRRGDPESMAVLEEARALIGVSRELQRIGPLAAALAEAAWFDEDTTAIVRDIQPAYALAVEKQEQWLTGELGVWLWRTGVLIEVPTGTAEPYALEIAGNWRAAARAWTALGCPYDQASVLARYGGETERREALATFERLGAMPAAQWLRKQLRVQGAKDIPRGSRTSTRNNRHGLTKREAQVLELLCEGSSNAAIARRLFLSTKTVDHHVSAILGKLGVTTRAMAVTIARKRVNESAS